MSSSCAASLLRALLFCLPGCVMSRSIFEDGRQFRIKLVESDRVTPSAVYMYAAPLMSFVSGRRQTVLALRRRAIDTGIGVGWDGRQRYVPTWEGHPTSTFYTDEQDAFTFTHGSAEDRVRLVHHGSFVFNNNVEEALIDSDLMCSWSNGATLVEERPDARVGQEWLIERANRTNRFKIRLVSGPYLTAQCSEIIATGYSSHCGFVIFRNISTAETFPDDGAQWELEYLERSWSEALYPHLNPALQALGLGSLAFYALTVSQKLFMCDSRSSQGLVRNIWIRIGHIWAILKDYSPWRNQPDEMAMARAVVNERRISFAHSSIRWALPLLAGLGVIAVYDITHAPQESYLRAVSQSTYLCVFPVLCLFAFMSLRPEWLTIRCLCGLHVFMTCHSVLFYVLVAMWGGPVVFRHENMLLLTFGRICPCVAFGMPHIGIPCFLLGSMAQIIIDMTAFDHTRGSGNIYLILNNAFIALFVAVIVLVLDASIWREARTHVELKWQNNLQMQKLLSAKIDAWSTFDSDLKAKVSSLEPMFVHCLGLERFRLDELSLRHLCHPDDTDSLDSLLIQMKSSMDIAALPLLSSVRFKYGAITTEGENVTKPYADVDQYFSVELLMAWSSRTSIIVGLTGLNSGGPPVAPPPLQVPVRMAPVLVGNPIKASEADSSIRHGSGSGVGEYILNSMSQMADDQSDAATFISMFASSHDGGQMTSTLNHAKGAQFRAQLAMIQCTPALKGVQ